eukprot:UN15540
MVKKHIFVSVVISRNNHLHFHGIYFWNQFKLVLYINLRKQVIRVLLHIFWFCRIIKCALLSLTGRYCIFFYNLNEQNFSQEYTKVSVSNCDFEKIIFDD